MRHHRPHANELSPDIISHFYTILAVSRHCERSLNCPPFLKNFSIDQSRSFILPALYATLHFYCSSPQLYNSGTCSHRLPFIYQRIQSILFLEAMSVKVLKIAHWNKYETKRNLFLKNNSLVTSQISIVSWQKRKCKNPPKLNFLSLYNLYFTLHNSYSINYFYILLIWSSPSKREV